MDDTQKAVSMLQSAVDGTLSETDAIDSLVEFGASEELLSLLGYGSERHAGITKRVMDMCRGNKALLIGVIAFLVSTGELYGYKVSKGDTLWGIAKSCGSSVEEIKKLNPQISGDLIRPGMEIALPGEPSSEASSNDAVYTVQKGDTAYAIAKSLGISLKELERLNPGTDLEHISVGQKLNVSSQDKTDTKKTDDQQSGATDEKTDYLAKVIYSETSSIATDMEVRLICRVIMNRVGRKGFSGNSDPYSIVHAKNQFSCTSGTDGNVNWKNYRRDLNDITKRDYGYAEKMMSGDTSFMPENNDIIFYCNKSLATGSRAVDKRNYLSDGKPVTLGHPAGFGDVVPEYMTEHFVFYKKK